MAPDEEGGLSRNKEAVAIKGTGRGLGGLGMLVGLWAGVGSKSIYASSTWT